MKNLNISFLFLILTIATSCQKEEIFYETNSLDPIMEIQNIPNEINENNEISMRTSCNIQGPSIVPTNSIQTFTYTTDMANSCITWIVISGDISLSNATGSSATFNFGNNFNGGTIKAIGSNGIVKCSEIKNIFCNGGNDNSGPQCPSNANLLVIHIEQCSDAMAGLSNANDVYKVDWEYSIGGLVNIPFDTTFNPNGSYSMTVPAYIPYIRSANWDNHYFQIHANITLTDGSTCYRWGQVLLHCDNDDESGGGGIF